MRKTPEPFFESNAEMIKTVQDAMAYPKINRELKEKMGREAPQMNLAEYRAYKSFVEEGLYADTLVWPAENKPYARLKRDEFFSLPEFTGIDMEEDRVRFAIVLLYGLKEIDRGLWAMNHKKIVQWWQVRNLK